MADRILQATDGTDVTFDEALRLVVATIDWVDWPNVAIDINGRPETTYLGSVAKAHELLLTAGFPEIATAHFESV